MGEEEIKEMQDKIGGFCRRFIMCESCAHKNVCKKIEDKKEKCDDFLNGGAYKVYGNIYDMFQPIFDWIKVHYPAGEVKFVVDYNSAKMYQEHGPFVVSKELKQPLGGIIEKKFENGVEE